MQNLALSKDNSKNKVKKIRSNFSIIFHMFKNKKVILSKKQPKTILPLLNRARFNTKITILGKKNGLSKFVDERC